MLTAKRKRGGESEGERERENQKIPAMQTFQINKGKGYNYILKLLTLIAIKNYKLQKIFSAAVSIIPQEK